MRVTISFTIPCSITTSEMLNHMTMDQALELIMRTAAEMLDESTKSDTYFDDVKLHHILRPKPDGEGIPIEPEERPVGEWKIEPGVTRFQMQWEEL